MDFRFEVKFVSVFALDNPYMDFRFEVKFVDVSLTNLQANFQLIHQW